MYSFTELQSNLRTSDFWTKSTQKKTMNDKNFERINIKLEISI